jgi:hypothetical protein
MNEPQIVLEIQRLEPGCVLHINGQPVTRFFRTREQVHAELNRLVTYLSEARLDALLAVDEHPLEAGEIRTVKDPRA